MLEVANIANNAMVIIAFNRDKATALRDGPFLPRKNFLSYFIKANHQIGTLGLSNTMLRTHGRLFNNAKKYLFISGFGAVLEYIVPKVTKGNIF